MLKDKIFRNFKMLLSKCRPFSEQGFLCDCTCHVLMKLALYLLYNIVNSLVHSRCPINVLTFIKKTLDSFRIHICVGKIQNLDAQRIMKTTHVQSIIFLRERITAYFLGSSKTS